MIGFPQKYTEGKHLFWYFSKSLIFEGKPFQMVVTLGHGADSGTDTDRINAKDVRTPWEDARHGRIELKMSGTVKGLIGDDNKENRNY